MLHNKRQRGILLAKLVEKISLYDPNDITDYPKNDSITQFNEHTLKLDFTYKNTSICNKVSYLLITYDNNIIEYEYTIHTRIWDYLE